MAHSTASQVVIEPWGEGDLDLLRRVNAPEMTEHLGGPESEEKVLDRHRRYLALDEPGSGAMFRVVALPEGEAVGTIGYWEREWRGETVYETGWSILPEFGGRGLATAAGRLVIERARAQRRHRFLHAYPSVDHPASNAICRRLGFTLLGACDFEYPPGRPMRCNDWRLEL
ncbi:GNAT family N-acetyltransferase [Actinoallomurus spadix]|uniref:GNAT family N-acetyltransferase n=1 Tax=Actinoallomurus spadix TaxID=79912 RepID=A0ABN0X5H6_9ACTN|nr:GNAT family N-acetyltransferase [Actinoallomurus spadix]MCO5986789.1 GNAT family N-acetyltransferase [Actinoallomurus spadix]